MPSLEVLSTLVFFAIVAILVYFDRKNIEFHSGLIIRRWTRGKEILDNFVSKHKKFVLYVGNFAVLVGLIASIAGFLLLLRFTFSLERMFGLVLPTAGGFQYPGPVLSIPFWYWFVGVFVIIFSHETMHAVFSRLENVRIKNYGVLLLLVLPIGAFVDPDMRQVVKLKFMKKLRIFVAGSFGNFVVGALVVLILIASLRGSEFLIKDIGVKFESTINGTPADVVGLSGTIIQLNNYTIKNRIDFRDVLNKTKIGDNVTIVTTDGVFKLQTIEHPDIPGRAYIGISNTGEVYEYKNIFSGVVSDSVVNGFFVWVRLLSWLMLLNFGVGIANLLPMKPFDGGFVFEEIFKKLFTKNWKLAIKISTYVTLSLILLNLFGLNILKNFI